MRFPKHLEKIALLFVFCSTSILIVGMGLAWRGNSYKPAYYAQHILAKPDKKISKALFSPRDNVKEVLLGLIESERKSISIASFRLTDQDIAQSLDTASRRGVKIRIVSDRACPLHQYSKIPFLAKNKRIDIRLYPPEEAPERERIPLMHNKYIIFEQSLYDTPVGWTGSFNFTRSAATINQENVVIFNDRELCKEYAEHFEQLFDLSSNYGTPARPREKEQEITWILAIWQWLHGLKV